MTSPSAALAAFLLYLRQFFEPMMEISQFYNTFQSASAALEKLAGVLAIQPSVPEPEAARAAGALSRGAALRPRAVRLRRGRTGAPRPRPHRARRPDPRPRGHDRAGKTTLAKLATRFYDPAGRPGAASTGSTYAA